MDQNLGVTILSSIELSISNRSFVDSNVMRNNERWLGFARDDHISQVTVVLLDIALAGANTQALTQSDESVTYTLNETCLKLLTFSNSFPKLINSIPFPEFSSGAPGSLGT
jgi:hypothetical protein